MEDRYVKKDFSLEIDRKTVLRLLDCHEDSPVYEQIAEEYEERIQYVTGLAEPKAVYYICGDVEEAELLSDCEENGLIYVFLTIGSKISQYSSELFQQGDALAGMMADAIADALLFSAQHQLTEELRGICQKKGLGIARRLEAPADIPMQMQKVILHKSGAEELFSVGLTEGFMYSPVKSTGYILITTIDVEKFHGKHNCRTCKAVNCKMREIEPVLVKIEGKDKKEVCCNEKETLLDALQNSGNNYSFACGGNGTCGKCRIQVLKGKVGISAEDKKFFSKQELEAGYRLACKAVPEEDCTVMFCGKEESSFEVMADFTGSKDGTSKEAVSGLPYIIGIDIGTTTLVVSLIETVTGNTAAVYSSVNRQRVYGADVIARIQASCEGQGRKLQQMIREDLLAGIEYVINKAGIKENEIAKIAVAGNTTMGHLLLGYSCETLGVFPFTPVDITKKELSFQEVFASDKYQLPVFMLPGISTFVGADITAGMLCLGFTESDKISLLIDLGTNGEMALGNCDKIYVTSTAAGPAFEAGNISCGTGSIPGAICDVVIEEDTVRVNTIGNKKPTGICGTGVIAALAELLKQGLVDETGLLDEEYFEDGFVLTAAEDGEKISLSQKDIREVQLAKSAVRAGMETLLLRYGVTYDQLDCVYLAGGFGYKVDRNKAAGIGLLPEALLSKVKAVGNSSLAGAVKALVDKSAQNKLDRICNISQEIDLSTDKAFQEFYMDYMMFE